MRRSARINNTHNVLERKPENKSEFVDEPPEEIRPKVCASLKEYKGLVCTCICVYNPCPLSSFSILLVSPYCPAFIHSPWPHHKRGCRRTLSIEKTSLLDTPITTSHTTFPTHISPEGAAWQGVSICIRLYEWNY